jgi:hypothetical protein
MSGPGLDPSAAAAAGERRRTGWRLAWLALTAAFILAAALNLMRVRGGFLTDHLADVAVPAWLYVHFRGLAGGSRAKAIGRFVGATPLRAAVLLFAASAATELSQSAWPRGPFPGTFDPLDFAAYAVGLAACLAADLATGGGAQGTPPRHSLAAR